MFNILLLVSLCLVKFYNILPEQSSSHSAKVWQVIFDAMNVNLWQPSTFWQNARQNVSFWAVVWRRRCPSRHFPDENKNDWKANDRMHFIEMLPFFCVFSRSHKWSKKINDFLEGHYLVRRARLVPPAVINNIYNELIRNYF